MLLEIACFNFESAKIAEHAGADRIELCENYSEGGITPQLELIQKVKSEIKIPVHVMIRPRGGNFVYTDSEFTKMKKAVAECKNLNAEGIVFGILDEKNSVDKKRCAELIALAKPLSAVFHRAFDEMINPYQAVEEIIDCGFSRILTSGHKSTASKGSGMISELITRAGKRIVIMPGGGVRAENISELINRTGAKEFHSAALNKDTMLPDENEIKEMKKIISQ